VVSGLVWEDNLVRSIWLGFAIGLLAGGSAEAALPGIYVTTSTGLVARVNTATGAIETSFDAGVGLTDIAASNTGQVYGTSFNSIYRLDLDAGTATRIGDHGVFGMNSLAFDAGGTLYAHSDRNANLFTVDLGTGVASAVGRTGLVSDGDLEFVGGNLLMTTRATGDAGLVRLDPADGSVISVFGGTTGFDQTFGLAERAGILYGFAQTSIFTIDPVTGAGTFASAIAAPGFGILNGATFLPTPLPLPIAMLGAALAGLGLAARRQRRGGPAS
jgi:outer membrane protein assembly factor BamB